MKITPEIETELRAEIETLRAENDELRNTSIAMKLYRAEEKLALVLDALEEAAYKIRELTDR